MKAREIMTSKPEVVTADEPISRAAHTMRTLDVGAMPVVENRSSMRLLGILTDRDLAVRHLAEGHAEDCPIRRHMTPRNGTRRFYTVRPEDTVAYAMDLMAEGQVHRIPVLDRDDERLVGIIALADIARELGPRHPVEVVNLLQAMSEPATERVPAPVS